MDEENLSKSKRDLDETGTSSKNSELETVSVSCVSCVFDLYINLWLSE